MHSSRRCLTLGPAGTFSERAARRFLQQQSTSELTFLPSLARTLNSVSHDDVAVVPIENLVEGFVSPVVDHLFRQPLQIIAELYEPVQFSYIAHSDSPSHLYAQFVAQGQCSEFLAKQSTSLVTTASNTEALALWQQHEHAAAVIPKHLTEGLNTPIQIADITDEKHNETRFIAVQQARSQAEPVNGVAYKTSLLLIDDDDHPGLLADSLQVFKQHQVNLTSIVSRPTGARFGQYHFFIDCDGHAHHAHLENALNELRHQRRVVCLGSYPAASRGTQ